MALVRDLVPADAKVEHLRLEPGDVLAVTVPDTDTSFSEELFPELPEGVVLIVLANGSTVDALSFRDLEELLSCAKPAEPA